MHWPERPHHLQRVLHRFHLGGDGGRLPAEQLQPELIDAAIVRP